MERLSVVQSHLCSSQTGHIDPVLKEWRGNCLKIILNRPKQYNTIGRGMYVELIKAIQEAESAAKVCIFKSTLPGKVFCAGTDLKELTGALKQRGNEGVNPNNKLIWEIAQAKPIMVAFWDGIVMGGGVGISIHSNIKIATENTVFSMPEAKLGYFTNVSSAYFLPRFRKNIGLFLAMTAYSLKGKEAYQVGAADYFVMSKNLPALEADIERLAQIPTVNEAIIRESIERYAENIPKKYDGEDIIAEVFEGQNVTEVFDKLKKGSQGNELVRKWYEDILKNCPLSHFYDFELLKWGKKLNLQEALSLEDYLAAKVNLNDFYEGVRTVLVDKGAKPNWSVGFDDLKIQKKEKYFPEQIKVFDYSNIKLKL